MKKLSTDEYNNLVQDARVLAEDEYGKKVLELADHSIIKLFRVKRLISQATLYSPARRFKRNAQGLISLNIPTVTIVSLYKIKSIKRTAVHYQPLEGLTVREYLQKYGANESFLSRLGLFLLQLHEQGVFFRSVHFGNIIYTPDKQFGLIDISDMIIYKSPLNKNKRLRNLKHFFRLAEDIELIAGSNVIEESYLEHLAIKSKKFRKTFIHTCRQLRQNPKR
jgi:hypothetical protein